MEKQGKGAIVNVSSIASIRSPKGISYLAYNASKGAVNSLTMAIASQYAEKGIRCNAILPGLMHTPMIDFLAEQYAKSEKDHNQAYEKMIAIRDHASPTGKMGTGWDTANAALFLASDQSAYVNGHLLVVDGGINDTGLERGVLENSRPAREINAIIETNESKIRIFSRVVPGYR